MQLKKTALNGFAWTLTQQLSVQVINFVVQIILARLLMPEHFGTIAVIQIFLTISQSLIDSGMTTSLIRSKEIDNTDYSTVFYMNFALSIFIYILLFVSSPFVSRMFDNSEITSVLRVLSVVLVLQSLTSVQATKLTKEMNFKLQMKLQVPSVLIAGISGIIFALLDFGVWSLVYMQIIRFLILTLSYLVRIRWVPEPAFSLDRFKYHFSFGYKLALTNLFTNIYNNIYSFLIGSIFNSRQLGLYSQANNLARFPVTNLSNTLLKVTFPLFSKISDDQELIRAFKKITQMVMLLVTPLMFLAVVVAEPLFRIVLTEKWNGSILFFQFLCCCVIFHPLNVYNINVLLVKGWADLKLKLEVIKKIITSFFFLLIIPFGIWGVLLAQGIGLILGFIFNSYFCSKVIKYSVIEQIRDILKIVLVSLVPMLASLFLDYYLRKFHLNLYVQLVLNSSIYLILFFSGIKMFKIKSVNDLRQTIREFTTNKASTNI